MAFFAFVMFSCKDSKTSSGIPLKSFGISVGTNPYFFSSESRAKRPFLEEAARILLLSLPSGIIKTRLLAENCSSSKASGLIFPIRIVKKVKLSISLYGTFSSEKAAASLYAAVMLSRFSVRAVSRLRISSILSKIFSASA